MMVYHFNISNYTMAKNRKKRKPKKAWVRSQKRRFDTKLELQNDLGELIVNSIKEDFEILETEFGPIKLSDGAVVYGLKNKAKIIKGLLLLLLFGIIGGVFWGIIKLFRWLF